MINFLVKYKHWFLLLVIIITILTALKTPSIKFNTDFSLFLSDNDPEYIFYKQLKSELKDEESIVIVGIEAKESVFNSKFLKDIQFLTESLKQLNAIKSVKGLPNLSYPVKSTFGLVEIPYIYANDSLDIDYSRNKIYKDFDITQHFVNEEGTVLLLWIDLKDNLNPKDIENVLSKINEIRNNFSQLNTFIWGRSYLKDALNKITKNETKKTMVWAFLFLILALSLLFKRKTAILYSILLLLTSFIVFVGGMAYYNRPFGLMSNLFPAIIIIVGMSDIIHLCIKYNIEIEKGKPAKIALHETIKEIGWAIFITSFTTAIGFFTLYLSPMKALRDFGIEAGIAVLLTFMITLLLTPILFSLTTKRQVFAVRKSFISFAKRFLFEVNKLYKFPRAILTVFFLILLISLYGIGRINTNNVQFSIPEKSELNTNYTFFEKTLKGSRSFEMALVGKNEQQLNDPQLLNSINDIHKFLDSIPYLNGVKSPINYYRVLDRTYNPSKEFNASFFLSPKDIKKYEQQFSSKSNYLINNDKTIFKVNAQIEDLGRHQITTINETILKHVNTLIDTSKVTVKITGIDYLFDRAHEQRINNMIFGLGLAILMVAIILGLLYMNLALIILALILNITPLIIGAGIMGFTNLELRSGTSIIFTLAFVIAVDDTIHLLSKFQWERKRGCNLEKALELAINECGLAILATSFILIGTFFILMLSGFEEIFTLGFITGVIILITLATDLILAPILMTKWFKPYL